MFSGLSGFLSPSPAYTFWNKHCFPLYIYMLYMWLANHVCLWRVEPPVFSFSHLYSQARKNSQSLGWSVSEKHSINSTKMTEFRLKSPYARKNFYLHVVLMLWWQGGGHENKKSSLHTWLLAKHKCPEWGLSCPEESNLLSCSFKLNRHFKRLLLQDVWPLGHT